MDKETLPIRPSEKVSRKRSRTQSTEDRITLNLTISRKARMILHLHEDHYRGTPKGTASGLVESLILDHLRRFRVSEHSASSAEPSAESA